MTIPGKYEVEILIKPRITAEGIKEPVPGVVEKFTVEAPKQEIAKEIALSQASQKYKNIKDSRVVEFVAMKTLREPVIK